MSGTVLRIEAVSKSFDRLKALNGMSLELSDGEILGLIGPNGSGKTTLINVVSGIFKPDQGKITMDSTNIAGLRPYKIAHLGLNRTYQTPRSFNSLTVRENLRVAMVYGTVKSAQSKKVRLDDIITMCKLGTISHEKASSLNSFHKKMLDLARALITVPRILLIDELAAGLNPEEMKEVGELLVEIRENGTSLIVVEHVMSFIKNLSNRVIVMDIGTKIYEGDFRGAANDQKVKEVYLGRKRTV